MIAIKCGNDAWRKLELKLPPLPPHKCVAVLSCDKYVANYNFAAELNQFSDEKSLAIMQNFEQ